MNGNKSEIFSGPSGFYAPLIVGQKPAVKGTGALPGVLKLLTTLNDDLLI